MDLSNQIKQYGNPDALIDCNDGPRYAIWGYKDYISLDSSGLYINDNAISGDSLSVLQSTLEEWCDDNRIIKAVGFISYNFNRYLYPHLSLKPIDSGLPYLWFGVPDRIESYTSTTGCDISDRDELSLKSDFMSINRYSKKIEIIKNELKEGNTYQINFTTDRIFKPLNNPLQTYLSVSRAACPKFGYYINTGSYSVLSFSPERFIKVKNSMIESWPMKGTRGRSMDKEEDINLIENLRSSRKDFSEHLMIVDLLRNDIGKIAKNMTVNVDPIFQIDSFPTVHQMVSRVYATLEDGTRFIDIIKAMFPSGSVTGAPKESSMDIINRIEDYSRGIYTGAIGHFTDINDYDFNIAIRTMVSDNVSAKYCAGGGIVWESNTQDEYSEIHIKSKIIDR